VPQALQELLDLVLAAAMALHLLPHLLLFQVCNLNDSYSIKSIFLKLILNI
jgi:hypothetical protein